MTTEILIIIGVSLLGLSFISQIVFGVLFIKRKSQERLSQRKYEDILKEALSGVVNRFAQVDSDATEEILKETLESVLDKFSQVSVLPSEKYEELNKMDKPFEVLRSYQLDLGNRNVKLYIVHDKLEGQHYFATESFVFSPRLK